MEYPDGIEPVDADSEFFEELCGLIDRHADDPQERQRYLYSLEDFQMSWLQTFAMSGDTWGQMKELNVKEDD